MKKLCVADSLIEADLLVARLRAHGIEAEVLDRHTIGMAPHLSPVLGGVRVQVSDEDLERAQKILKTPPLSLVSDQTPMELREYEPIPPAQRQRPSNILSAATWLFWIALGLYFLLRSFF